MIFFGNYFLVPVFWPLIYSCRIRNKKNQNIAGHRVNMKILLLMSYQKKLVRIFTFSIFFVIVFSFSPNFMISYSFNDCRINGECSYNKLAIRETGCRNAGRMFFCHLGWIWQSISSIKIIASFHKKFSRSIFIFFFIFGCKCKTASIIML